MFVWCACLIAQAVAVGQDTLEAQDTTSTAKELARQLVAALEVSQVLRQEQEALQKHEQALERVEHVELTPAQRGRVYAMLMQLAGTGESSMQSLGTDLPERGVHTEDTQLQVPGTSMMDLDANLEEEEAAFARGMKTRLTCPQWPQSYEQWQGGNESDMAGDAAGQSKFLMAILAKKSRTCDWCTPREKYIAYMACLWKPDPKASCYKDHRRRRGFPNWKLDPGILDWPAVAPDLRPEMQRLGNSFNTLQKEIKNGLTGFLTQVKVAFDAMTKAMKMTIQDKMTECQDIAETMQENIAMFEMGCEQITDNMATVDAWIDSFIQDSETAREERDGQYNHTVDPIMMSISGRIHGITKDMKRFKKTRAWQLEGANSQRDKELVGLTEANKDAVEVEKLALANEERLEGERVVAIREFWDHIQVKIQNILYRAGESYNMIDDRTKKQLRRVNKRVVSRMRLFDMLKKELAATAHLATAAVLEKDRSKKTEVKMTYADTLADLDGTLRVLEKDVAFAWKTYTEGLKGSYNTIDRENSATVAKQNSANGAVRNSEATLLAIEDEFRAGQESLSKYTQGMRDQVETSTQDAIATNLKAVQTMGDTLNLENMRILSKVKDDARKELLVKQSDVQTKSQRLQDEAHRITEQAEFDADQKQSELENLQRGSMGIVAKTLEDMRNRQDKAYIAEDARIRDLDEKVMDQDSKFSDLVSKKRLKALDDVMTTPGDPTMDPQSVVDAGTTAVSQLAAQTETFKKEIDDVQTNLDTDIDVHSAAVKSKAEEMAVKAYKKTYKAQEAAEKTGIVINQLLPALKDASVSKATQEMQAIHHVEDHLKETTKQAVMAASMAENVESQNFVSDSNTVGQGIGATMAASAEQNDATLQQTSKDVSDFVNQASLAHHEAEKVADQSTFDAKGVLKQVGAETAAVMKGLAASQEIASRAVHADSKVADKERMKALSAIKQGLSTSQHAGLAKANGLSKEADDGASASELGAETELAETKKTAVDEADSLAQQYADKLATAQKAFRSLVAGIKGLAANTTEWGSNLEDALGGVRGVAHREQMVGAQTRLEQQAAIDTRYRELQALVGQDVEGLSEHTRSQMAALTAESKKHAAAVLASTTMSEEEKLKALESIDSWLVGELNRVQDTSAAEQSEMESADGSAVDFAADARERAYHLKALVDADHASGSVDVSHDEVSIDELIKDADGRSNSIFKGMHQKFATMKDVHAGDATRIRQKAATDMRVALEAMTSAVALKNAAEHALETAAHSRTHSLTKEEQELQDLVDTAQTSRKGLASQIGATTSDREQRYDFLDEWTKGFQTTSAESLEELTKLMYQLVQNDKDYFAEHSEKIAIFAEHLADVINSDSIQTLSKIGSADKGADAMIHADTELVGKTEEYDRATARYRQKVATSLDHLTGGLTGELAKLSTRAKDFDYGLKKDADAWQSKSEDELRDMLKGQEKAVQTEQHRMQHQLDELRTEFATQMTETSQDASEVAQQVEAEGDEAGRQESNLHEEFDALAGSVTDGGQVEAYARTLSDLLKAKQAELDDARERLDIRVKGLSAVVATGDTASGDSDSLLQIAQDSHFEQEQKEYRRLVAEHEQLASRAKRLAVEARRVHTA